jgi:hypothetical protein
VAQVQALVDGQALLLGFGEGFELGSKWQWKQVSECGRLMAAPRCSSSSLPQRGQCPANQRTRYWRENQIARYVPVAKQRTGHG